MTREEFMKHAEGEINCVLTARRNRMMNLVEQAWAEGKRNAEIEAVTALIKGAFEQSKEPARCKYLHIISHDNEYRCWGQKDAPLCGCGGDTAKCEIFPPEMEGG